MDALAFCYYSPITPLLKMPMMACLAFVILNWTQTTSYRFAPATGFGTKIITLLLAPWHQSLAILVWNSALCNLVNPSHPSTSLKVSGI